MGKFVENVKNDFALMKRAITRDKADLTALIVTILLTVGMGFGVNPSWGMVIYVFYILGVMYRMQKKDDFYNKE